MISVATAATLSVVLLASGVEAVRVSRDLLTVDTFVDSSSFAALDDGFVSRQVLTKQCTEAHWYQYVHLFSDCCFAIAQVLLG
jgi:hypothetical protein